MALLSRTIGGILLVAGTTIGAAMLALPISTGVAGWIPSSCVMVLTWAYLTYTAFLFLELSLSFPQEANIITMAEKTLGLSGRLFAWGSYFFLLYALNTAYLALGSSLLSAALSTLCPFKVPLWIGALALFLFFGYAVYRGHQFVDRLNRFLMLAICLSFIALLSGVLPHVENELLLRSDWRASFLGLSVVVTSFGFHIVIPTLSSYLYRDVKSLKQVLWVGSLLPLIAYLLWNLAALGAVPLQGEGGIQQAFNLGLSGAYVVSHYIDAPWLIHMGSAFSFFAIVTSLLGVSLSLSDCLSDSLKIKKTAQGKGLLNLLTFGPPLILTLTSPRAFLTALEYAGAFGVATLLGILPCLMAWRRRQAMIPTYQVPGGKFALILIISYSLLIILLEIVIKIGVLC